MSDTLGWELGWVVGCPFYYEFNQLCNNIVYVKKNQILFVVSLAGFIIRKKRKWRIYQAFYS